jgi:F-type H+-transporting ATPase subunit b
MAVTARNRLFAVLALALGLTLVIAAPSGAAGEEGDGATFTDEQVEEIIHEAEEIAEQNDATHADAECIPILVEGGTVEECQEAPNPILPETNEIIWGAFGFLIVFGFLLWKGVPAIKKTMNDRTEKIRGDIEGAEAAKAEADKVLAEYHSQLADARNEAARILEEARQDADAVKAERIAAIQPEIDEMRARAASEIEASKAQALSELRGEITAIALGAAERVVERNLDDETNRALIDSYIDSVGAQS